MPQMSPMLWFSLYIYFIVLLLLFISIFYYIYTPVQLIGENKKNNYKLLYIYKW